MHKLWINHVLYPNLSTKLSTIVKNLIKMPFWGVIHIIHIVFHNFVILCGLMCITLFLYFFPIWYKIDKDRQANAMILLIISCLSICFYIWNITEWLNIYIRNGVAWSGKRTLWKMGRDSWKDESELWYIWSRFQYFY